MMSRCTEDSMKRGGEEEVDGKVLRVTAEVVVPMVPDYIRTIDGQAVPLHAFLDEDLERMGQEWTKALVMRAREQREDREGDEDG